MRTFLSALALALVLAGCGQGGDGQDTNQDASAEQATADSSAAAGEFDSVAAKRSYALGMDIGNSLKSAAVELSIPNLTAGIKDVLQGEQPRLSDEELHAALGALVSEMQAAAQQKQMAEAKKNVKAGKAFRAEYKQKEGVKATDSGLLYKVVEKGQGDSPDADDRVKVHYEGRLIDGTVFDSSRKRGTPAVFPVDAVIPGWTEALQLMQEGGHYELVIPPELAYGARGAGAKIGPNETLVFDVELIKVLSDEEQAGDANGESQSNGDSDAHAQ